MKLLSALTAALLLGTPALADNPDAGKMAWYYCVAKDYPDMSVLVVQQESEFGTDASAFVPGNENYDDVLVPGRFNVFHFNDATRHYAGVADDYQSRAEALFENREAADWSYRDAKGTRPIDTLTIITDTQTEIGDIAVFEYSPRQGSTSFNFGDGGGTGATYGLRCEEPWAEDAQ